MALLDFVSIDFYFKFFFALLTLATDKNSLTYSVIIVHNRHFITAVRTLDFVFGFSGQHHNTPVRSPPFIKAAAIASFLSCSDWGSGKA